MFPGFTGLHVPGATVPRGRRQCQSLPAATPVRCHLAENGERRPSRRFSEGNGGFGPSYRDATERLVRFDNMTCARTLQKSVIHMLLCSDSRDALDARPVGGAILWLEGVLDR